MSSEYIDYNLAELALERLSGVSFENFANAFFSGILGTKFVPLGGSKDGGADAFRDSCLWQDKDPKGIFYQASIETTALRDTLPSIAANS